jgi:hypothetical protein
MESLVQDEIGDCLELPCVQDKTSCQAASTDVSSC